MDFTKASSAALGLWKVDPDQRQYRGSSEVKEYTFIYTGEETGMSELSKIIQELKCKIEEKENEVETLECDLASVKQEVMNLEFSLGNAKEQLQLQLKSNIENAQNQFEKAFHTAVLFSDYDKAYSYNPVELQYVFTTESGVYALNGFTAIQILCSEPIEEAYRNKAMLWDSNMQPVDKPSFLEKIPRMFTNKNGYDFVFSTSKARIKEYDEVETENNTIKIIRTPLEIWFDKKFINLIDLLPDENVLIFAKSDVEAVFFISGSTEVMICPLRKRFIPKEELG